MEGALKEDTALPSVRALARELKVSALTVKKAYDELEAEGFVVTVHGKGSYVSCAGQEIMLEERRKEVESDHAIFHPQRAIQVKILIILLQLSNLYHYP